VSSGHACRLVVNGRAIGSAATITPVLTVDHREAVANEAHDAAEHNNDHDDNQEAEEAMAGAEPQADEHGDEQNEVLRREPFHSDACDSTQASPASARAGELIIRDAHARRYVDLSRQKLAVSLCRFWCVPIRAQHVPHRQRGCERAVEEKANDEPAPNAWYERHDQHIRVSKRADDPNEVEHPEPRPPTARTREREKP
jgi:hypothetical protein